MIYDTYSSFYILLKKLDFYVISVFLGIVFADDGMNTFVLFKDESRMIIDEPSVSTHTAEDKFSYPITY